MMVRALGGARRVGGGALVCGLLALVLGCATEPKDDVRAVRDAADVALAQGQTDAALAAYRTALDLAPDDAGARLGAARALAARGDLDLALAAYDAYAEVAPEPASPRVRDEVCSVHSALVRRDLAAGEIDSALGAARRLESEPCRLEEVTPLLGAALRAAGQRAEAAGSDAALALYMEAIRLDSAHVSPYLRAARLLMHESRVDEAIELLAEALTEHPRDPDLQALMVDALSGREAGTTHPPRRDAAP